MQRISLFLHKNFNYLQLGMFLASALLILLRPVVIFKDSYGYMEGSLIRLPVYPLFLKGLRFVFGDSFQFAAVFIQMLFVFAAIYFFIRTLKKHVQLPSYWILILTLILLAPCLYDKNIANSILSEAASYGLFLFTVSYLIEGLCSRTNAAFYKAGAILLVLLLTRGQFIFLVPVALLSVTWHLIHSDRSWKDWVLPILVLFIPLLSGVLEKSYHKATHDVYVSTPWTGIHLFTPALYVASAEDAAVFTSEEEKAFFLFALDRIKTKGWSSYQTDGKQKIDIDFYIKNFTEIANSTLYLEGKEFIGPQLTETQKFIQLDELTKRMTLPLIKKNPKKWLELYVKNFIHAFGTTKGFLLWIVVLLLVGWRMLQQRTSENKIIVFSLLLLCANAATLSIGIMTIKRYLFYNDWVLFLIVFILLNSFLQSKKTT